MTNTWATEDTLNGVVYELERQNALLESLLKLLQERLPEVKAPEQIATKVPYSHTGEWIG